MVIDALENKKTKKSSLTPAMKQLQSLQSQQQFKEVSAYLLFVLTTGLSIGFYVNFKTYHASLAKMESLKKLLENPNARVAHGDTGKSILKRLRADEKKTEVPKEIAKSTKANETVDLIK